MARRKSAGTIRGTLLGMAILALAVPRTAGAQQPCAGPEYRQFDFWIGEWEVRDTSGAVLGHNTIESILGGCVLHESWRSAKSPAGAGHSHNIYNATAGRWHQAWVDASRSLLLIDGGLDEEGRMVMSGETTGPSGARVLNRITWAPRPPDVVRQLWETSRDGGRTWTVVFDGYYHRAKD